MNFTYYLILEILFPLVPLNQIEFSFHYLLNNIYLFIHSFIFRITQLYNIYIIFLHNLNINKINNKYLSLISCILLSNLYDRYTLDHNDFILKQLFIKTSFKIILTVFFGMIIPFTYVDYYKIYPFYKYKVKIEKNTLTIDLLYKTLKLVMINLLLIPIISYLSYPFIKIQSNFSFFDFLYFPLFIIVEEIGFYTTHRILHLPFFYKHFHKIHHEWKYPIALSCIYAHPFEFIFSNLSPTIFTMFLLSYLNIVISIYVYWLWMIIGFMNTIWVHSGYSRKTDKQYLPHFYHHISFGNNYGISIFMDKLFGTYKTIDRIEKKLI
jgi:sterol desaturase/sphingolipid hydroxylase (fatty acid hydroxylase superfamily)